MAQSNCRDEDSSAWVFRALLALYPTAFRDEYDRELTLVFIDRYRDAAGSWERARLWLDVLRGIASEAPKEHYRMILQDLRYAWRGLRHHSVVTITIVLTLGLGIGANTAMFSMLNAVVLRTLPVPDPEQLFMVTSTVQVGDRFSGPMFERLHEGAPPGVEVAAMSRVVRVYTRTRGRQETEPAALQLVSSNYFQLFLASPALSTTLAKEVENSPVAVVSYRYWQRSLASAPDVVGSAVTINGTTFTIVGVGPRGFGGVWLESPVDVWAPLTMQREVRYSQNFSADHADLNRPWLPQERISWLDLIVRSPPAKAGVAASGFSTIVRNVGKRDARITLEPFATGFSGFRQRFAKPLYALMAMAGLVLLIACGNIANLLLARAADRQREMALRMSMGAGRTQILHQLLTESVLLVMLAGAVAVLFARWAGDLLVRTATASANDAPFSADVDLRVLAFTGVVAFVSLLLFGLMPAWRATRTDLITALKTGGRASTGSSGAGPARLLVVLQVALSMVLVTGTGLLVSSLRNLLDVDLGFQREHLLTVAIDPRLSGAAKPPDPVELRRVLDHVAAVPGVQSVSLAMCGLLSGCRSRMDFSRIEADQGRPGEKVLFLLNLVTPDYFSTVGMRLIAGRTFTDHDQASPPRLAIVNEALARKYFKSGQAVGRRFGEKALDIEIVGVVKDARTLSVKDPAEPTVFFPLPQQPVLAREVQVRTQGEPQQAVTVVRRAITQAAPYLTLEGIVTMDERVRLSLSQERLVVFLTSGFGALALGLAGFGLFGVLWHAVARRASEFGLRMALGASQSLVLWGVLREALLLVLFGCVLGVPFVLLGGRAVSALFFGVTPYDWTILSGAAVTLFAVGACCSLLPAIRASRVDPMVALRQE